MLGATRLGAIGDVLVSQCLVVTVGGEPVPTARVRVNGGRASTPRRTVEYQAMVARAARHAMREQRWPERYDGPVRISITIFGANLNTDGDNIQKGVVDALVKAGSIRDDCLRYVRSGSWVYAGESDKPGIVVNVEMLGQPGGRCT